MDESNNLTALLHTSQNRLFTVYARLAHRLVMLTYLERIQFSGMEMDKKADLFSFHFIGHFISIHLIQPACSTLGEKQIL